MQNYFKIFLTFVKSLCKFYKLYDLELFPQKKMYKKGLIFILKYNPWKYSENIYCNKTNGFSFWQFMKL